MRNVNQDLITAFQVFISLFKRLKEFETNRFSSIVKIIDFLNSIKVTIL